MKKNLRLQRPRFAIPFPGSRAGTRSLDNPRFARSFFYKKSRIVALASIVSIVAILISGIFSGCAKSPPADELIFELIKTESVLSSHDYLELKAVEVKSFSWEDVQFKAVLKLTFLCNVDSKTWSREDKYDFIPSGTALVKGVNSIDATAFFERSYAGDGSWHLAKFSP